MSKILEFYFLRVYNWFVRKKKGGCSKWKKTLIILVSLFCITGLNGYGNNSPVLNREIKEAVNRSEGITPSDFLGKEVSSPEYYASNDAHAHRKRAKIEKDAEYTYSENKQLAKLSPWMSVNNLDVIITNSYALLNSFSVTTTKSTSYQSEWGLQAIAGVPEDMIKASSKKKFDLSFQQSYSFSCSIEADTTIQFEFSDAAIKYAKAGRYQICVAVVADFYTVEAKIWTQRWGVWGWQHLSGTDETIKANFISHYYITAIFYNPLTKEIILHECD